MQKTWDEELNKKHADLEGELENLENTIEEKTTEKQKLIETNSFPKFVSKIVHSYLVPTASADEAQANEQPQE